MPARSTSAVDRGTSELSAFDAGRRLLGEGGTVFPPLPRCGISAPMRLVQKYTRFGDEFGFGEWGFLGCAQVGCRLNDAGR